MLNLENILKDDKNNNDGGNSKTTMIPSAGAFGLLGNLFGTKFGTAAKNNDKAVGQDNTSDDNTKSNEAFNKNTSKDHMKAIGVLARS